jgi:hypothetical protein
MFSLTQAQERALYTWAQVNTGITVFYAGQETEKPARPYLTLSMLTPPTSQYLQPTKIGATETTKIANYSEIFTLSILAKDDTDAMRYCNQLLYSLDKNDVKALLHQVGLYPKYCHAPVSSEKKVFLPLATKIEYNAVLDVVFGRTTAVSAVRSIITDVEITYEED